MRIHSGFAVPSASRRSQSLQHAEQGIKRQSATNMHTKILSDYLPFFIEVTE
jgi:hypothetical protein